ncbi:3053285c-8b62-4d7d-9ae3-d5ffa89e139b [Thermothielavioides terrestris]|uniref:3053285c-8b62-4d7d-9ae3-d5ffa89e139b n=1 Tax=Thermothielavioides terrestris TaxID=2587410 RepID=A0A446BVW4_9PEZI|nr:3053285c-8b62-4d7d-9ae3-d5ffa89e139b [Thermothielavioides terrestris]
MESALNGKTPSAQVVGTTSLYENGQIRLIPAPSPDPKDPLNLPEWRRWAAIASLCFFGSLALSAEIIVGSLIPVFLLYYSGVDVRILNAFDFRAVSGGSATGVNPLAIIPQGVVPADIGKVSMLATIPLLSNGIASYFLVPLSIGIGRRPVLLFAGACAWAGGFLAVASPSLDVHLAARAIQASVLSTELPPPDMVFIHQRNKAMAAVVASQGILITGLGILTPYLASVHDWRWIYYITSGFGIVAWLLLVVFLPETRWTRSKEELSGQQFYPIEPGKNRPEIDYGGRPPPSQWSYMALFQHGFEWRQAGMSMLNTLRTTPFPAIVWATLANSIFVIVNSAAQQISSFALLAQGWQFQYTGLSVMPFIAATGLVYIFGGPVADRISNAIARRNGGAREPEHHLLNMVLPLVSGLAGTFIFGWAGQTNAYWAVLMVGSFLIIFGSLVVMSVLNVFVVESYPMWAGPVLVNVSSLRIIIAFFLSSQSTTWIAEKGFLNTFVIYSEVMIVISLGIPVLYFFGRKMRQWTAGKVKTTAPSDVLKKEFDDSLSERSA